MTSSQIRQSFLDFFKSKQHTVVPSSSLMPDSPNLLFTNAGMNQFVPIFLGQVKCPYTPGRAADTQKCIRAGGKHNDLEDVGLDTYHHTFFEMLGNWSFGDYFKKEAIEWAWELVTEVWKFPKERIYATVYCPHMNMERWQRELQACVGTVKVGPARILWDDELPGESAINRSDRESVQYWAALFLKAGMDPMIHIVPGGRKDNFWMMGETGPCGPCSELHVDLTPNGDTKGALVNKGSAQCIEIWNLVFMQFNANPDGSFVPLPAKSVDTGMGFERVTSIMQCTQGFKKFDGIISNYETDIFRPIFDRIEQLSGKRYGSTLPAAGSEVSDSKSQIAVDVAFRVIADHIRTLSFAIADGIQPGNTDRNYVLRRILRRAVRYGRTLGFHEPFFFKLVDVLAETMGDVFPEIRAKQKHVREVIRVEEEAFNKTLDGGLKVFEDVLRLKHSTVTLRKTLADLLQVVETVEGDAAPDLRSAAISVLGTAAQMIMLGLRDLDDQLAARIMERADLRRLEASANALASAVTAHGASTKPADQESLSRIADHFRLAIGEFLKVSRGLKGVFNGEAAFLLYDTYGFPLDLTELMARERGLTVDKEGFKKLMEEQKTRARAAQKKTVISLSQIETQTPTTFVGYDKLETPAKVLEVVQLKDKTAVILDTSACYAEMGGQVGDTGELEHGANLWRVSNTQKSGNTWLHFIEEGGARPSRSPGGASRADLSYGGTPTEAGETPALPIPGSEVLLTVDTGRRNAIQRHHTVTHLLHWALHEVVSKDASQKGSFVGPDKLTFDFNHAPLTSQQVADVEKLVNERILENAGVSWVEVKYDHVKGRPDVMQFFGDKYGEWVRVVQIGGKPTGLDGYSMELCGGTHTRATGEIGLFRITGENAIAAGVRRIEAIAGLTAYDVMRLDREMIRNVAGKVNSPIHELEKKIESLLEQQKALEKQLKAAQQKEAAGAAKGLVGKAATINGIPAIIENLGGLDGDTLQGMVNELKGQFKGVIVLGGAANGAVALIASVSPEFTAKIQAGKIIQQIAPIVGGKGGGKPDNARGGGKDVTKLDEALAKAKTLF